MVCIFTTFDVWSSYFCISVFNITQSTRQSELAAQSRTCRCTSQCHQSKIWQKALPHLFLFIFIIFRYHVNKYEQKRSLWSDITTICLTNLISILFSSAIVQNYFQFCLTREHIHWSSRVSQSISFFSACKSSFLVFNHSVHKPLIIEFQFFHTLSPDLCFIMWMLGNFAEEPWLSRLYLCCLQLLKCSYSCWLPIIYPFIWNRSPKKGWLSRPLIVFTLHRFNTIQWCECLFPDYDKWELFRYACFYACDG